MSTLNYLESFLVVGRTGNVSLAAKSLGLSQSSLSRQMKLLEEQLGVRLFLRQQRGVRLTREGLSLLKRLEPAMSQLHEVLEDTQEERQSLIGTVAMGSLTEIGQELLFPALLRFQKRHPTVRIIVEYLQEVEIVKRLKQGELDLALVTQPKMTGNLVSTPVTQEQIILVTRMQNPRKKISPEEIKELPFVAYRREDPLLMLYLKHVSANKKITLPHVVLAVNSHKSMLAALLENDYWSVLPSHSVTSYLQTGVLQKALPHEINGMLYLVYRRAQLRQRIGRHVINFLKLQLKSNPSP